MSKETENLKLFKYDSETDDFNTTTFNVQQALNDNWDKIDSQMADITTQQGELKNLKTTNKTNLVNAVNEIFTSASNGKTKVATAITGKGVPASGSDSYDTLSSKITSIKVGDYSVGDYIPDYHINQIYKYGEVWSFTNTCRDIIREMDIDKNNYIYYRTFNSIAKVSPEGNEVWTINISSNDSFNVIHLGNNGYLYVIYQTYRNYYFIQKRRISDGEEISSRSIDYGISAMKVDNNGNIYCITIPDGDNNRYIKKINCEWDEIFSYNVEYYATQFVIDNNGYFYITSTSTGGIKKMSPDGKTVWSIGYSNKPFINQSAVATDTNYVYVSFGNILKQISSNGEERWNFTGHTSNINSIAIDKEGYIYTGSDDKTVKKISPNGREIWTFKEQDREISSVTIDNQNYIYSGSYDNTIKKIKFQYKIV